MAGSPPQSFIPPHRRVAALKAKELQCQTSLNSHSVPSGVQDTPASPRDCGAHVSQSTEPRARPAVPTQSRNKNWSKTPTKKSGRWGNRYNNVPKKDIVECVWDNSPAWDIAPAWGVTPTWNIPAPDESTVVNDDGSCKAPLGNWGSHLPIPDYHSAKTIEIWLGNVALESDPLQPINKDKFSTNFHQTIPSPVGPPKCYYFSSTDVQDAMGPIVPLSWVPDPMGEFNSLSNFWKSIKTNAQPVPCHMQDLDDVKPWWECILAPTACFQLPYEQPLLNGFDCFLETPRERSKRLGDRGANVAISRWKANRFVKSRGHGNGQILKNASPSLNAHSQQAQDPGPAPWVKEQDDRAAPPSLNAHIEQAEDPEPALWVKGQDFRAIPPSLSIHVEQADDTEPTFWVNNTQEDEVVYKELIDTSIHPKVNLYLRGVETGDMAQITQIYNYYATKTVRVPECKAVLPDYMLDKLRAIDSVSHIFMVACLAGGHGKRANGKRNKDRCITSADRIIGFAYSKDFDSSLGMYRFLGQVEVYTDPEFTQKGVASCLMDKMTAILDPHFIARGGYEIRDDWLGLAGTRLVNCLWINFSYAPEDGDKDWTSKWLQSMGFEQTGHHKNVGFKTGKGAHLAVFTRPTGCEVDPMNPPITSAER